MKKTKRTLIIRNLFCTITIYFCYPSRSILFAFSSIFSIINLHKFYANWCYHKVKYWSLPIKLYWKRPNKYIRYCLTHSHEFHRQLNKLKSETHMWEASALTPIIKSGLKSIVELRESRYLWIYAFENNNRLHRNSVLLSINMHVDVFFMLPAKMWIEVKSYD